MLKFLTAAIAALCVIAGSAAAAPPVIETRGEAEQLIVNGEPFLMLGGELGNSSAGPAWLEPHWETFEAIGLNTILAPVYWELIEPAEGDYDFSTVDGLIEQARAHDIKLVLLWFGTWKNSMSSYAPSWVKRDTARFPRAVTEDGRRVELVTPFSGAGMEADATAFRALMEHLRRTDSRQQTVIMVQVENEIGMIDSPRDHSALADAAWAQPVPGALRAELDRRGDALAPEMAAAYKTAAPADAVWAEVFGNTQQAEEVFMAWHFGRYVEHVAAAGQAAYDLPMYVNAALWRPGHEPGQYPSAGPLPHIRDVWEAAAPSIDMLSFDIYFDNFVHWAGRYDWPGNAVFVPEANRAGAGQAGANAFYVFGAHDAIGFSPFWIEQLDPAEDPLVEAYAILAGMMPAIASAQQEGRIEGLKAPVAFDGTVDDSIQTLRYGDYTFTLTFIDPWTAREDQTLADHGGLIIRTGPEEWLVAGKGITMTFDVAGGEAGIEAIDEGRMVDGQFVPVRRLNGDQTHQGRHLRLPPGEFGVQRLRLYRY